MRQNIKSAHLYGKRLNVLVCLLSLSYFLNLIASWKQHLWLSYVSFSCYCFELHAIQTLTATQKHKFSDRQTDRTLLWNSQVLYVDSILQLTVLLQKSWIWHTHTHTHTQWCFKPVYHYTSVYFIYCPFILCSLGRFSICLPQFVKKKTVSWSNYRPASMFPKNTVTHADLFRASADCNHPSFSIMMILWDNKTHLRIQPEIIFVAEVWLMLTHTFPVTHLTFLFPLVWRDTSSL